jgi:hypothetical protein
VVSLNNEAENLLWKFKASGNLRDEKFSKRINPNEKQNPLISMNEPMMQ